MRTRPQEVVLLVNEARFPAISVLANGSPLSGVLSVSTNNNSYAGADRFSLEVAIDTSGYAVWSPNTVELDVSLGISGVWQTLVSGTVDRLEVDAGAGLILIDGRDLASRFISARIQQSFENRTSSEIVTELALKRNLTPNVVATSYLVGRNFGGDYTQLTLDQFSGVTTEWDLLTRLADFENYDVWVEGHTLNFMPSTQPTNSTIVTPQDCLALRLDRRFPLCSDLQVIVKSWDCRSQQIVLQTAGGSVTNDGIGSYVLVRPNLTEAAAADLASKTLNQIAQNGRSVTLEMAGDLVSKPRQSLTLVNTNTDFDGTYYVVSVERHISFERGFTQTIQARTPPWTTFSTI